ncbi:MAG: bifunctional anthranilate synthase component I family protein/class IV aminotransferase, partial [Candidatus Eremiobacteraeota bacterium]|nr:bifunctional anthranilate synthase component I family protein/class IV aminotransferase [Candidatus Eremiobacteraeota bacterium]
IAQIHDAIREGNVYQVNYTIPFDLNFEGDPLAAYASMVASGNAAYPAYVRDSDLALVSLSPELFLQFEANRVVTKPMKGTADLDRLDELENAKNRAEHVMIVDLLRNDLQRICGTVRVERIFEVERYPTLATMTSTISAALPTSLRLRDLFTATFPCGSITGAPKHSAMSTIAQLERRARGVYTGSIGYLSPQRRGIWNVAIRTLQIDLANGSAQLDAGGGIVADSRADDEWTELMIKTHFVRDGEKPFALLETLAIGPNGSDVNAHLARLTRSAEMFSIPLEPDDLLNRLNVLDDGSKLLIRIRLGLSGELAIRVEPLPLQQEPVRICLADARVRSDDPMLAHKTTWRPAHNAAAEQAADDGCFDALLCNERGELTEGARTTLFARIGNRIVTPPLDCGVLPGIFRQRAIAEDRAIEQVLSEADLRTAGGIYVANSARGWLETVLV